MVSDSSSFSTQPHSFATVLFRENEDAVATEEEKRWPFANCFPFCNNYGYDSFGNPLNMGSMGAMGGRPMNTPFGRG